MFFFNLLTCIKQKNHLERWFFNFRESGIVLFKAACFNMLRVAYNIKTTLNIDYFSKA